MKKIIILMLTMIFLLNTVSALDFDNVGTYNESIQEMIITNNFGLGDDIAKIRLNTKLVENVIRGNDRLVAIFTIENLQDYTNAFKDLELFEADTMQEVSREINYKYISDYEITNRTKYEYHCYSNETNGTCEDIIVGYVINEKPVWENVESYKFDELETGILTIGLFTDVYANDNIEWIPTLFGVEIEEWAVWTESLNVDLDLYYNCDDSDEEISHTYNLTANEGSMNYTEIGALVGSSCRFTANNNVYIPNNSDINIWGVSGGDSGYGTMNYWIYRDTATQYYFMSNYADWNYNHEFQAGGKLYMGVHAPINAVATSQSYGVSGEWIMITEVHNDTSGSVYVNGTLMETGTAGHNIVNALKLGSTNTDASDLVGYMDEIGIWSRELSAGEIIQLYNSGSGLTYIGEFNTEPNVTLDSPVNTTVEDLTPDLIFTPTDAEESYLDCYGYVNDTISGYVNATNGTSSSITTNYTLTAETNYTWFINCSDGTAEVKSEIAWLYPSATAYAPASEIEDGVYLNYTSSLVKGDVGQIEVIVYAPDGYSDFNWSMHMAGSTKEIETGEVQLITNGGSGIGVSSVESGGGGGFGLFSVDDDDESIADYIFGTTNYKEYGLSFIEKERLPITGDCKTDICIGDYDYDDYFGVNPERLWEIIDITPPTSEIVYTETSYTFNVMFDTSGDYPFYIRAIAQNEDNDTLILRSDGGKISVASIVVEEYNATEDAETSFDLTDSTTIQTIAVWVFAIVFVVGSILIVFKRG